MFSIRERMQMLTDSTNKIWLSCPVTSLSCRHSEHQTLFPLFRKMREWDYGIFFHTKMRFTKAYGLLTKINEGAWHHGAGGHMFLQLVLSQDAALFPSHGTLHHGKMTLALVFLPLAKTYHLLAACWVLLIGPPSIHWYQPMTAIHWEILDLSHHSSS